MKNPPAFPLPEYREFSRSESAEGMTLRDYFAGQALAGFASQYGISGADAQIANAIRCYQIADVMLTERSKGAYPKHESASEANTRPIAEAQDLLKSLKQCVREYEIIRDAQPAGKHFPYPQHIIEARKIIARAEGVENEFTGEPDPTDLARDYNEAAEHGNQPTEYDP